MAGGYQGQVAAWHADKGFGFIAPADGGKQIFVHVSSCLMAQTAMVVGATVKYQLSTDKKGRVCAVNVVGIARLIDGESLTATFEQWSGDQQFGVLLHDDYPNVRFILPKVLLLEGDLLKGQRVRGVLKLHSTGCWLLLKPVVLDAPPSTQAAATLTLLDSHPKSASTSAPKAAASASTSRVSDSAKPVPWRENMSLTGVLQNWQDDKGYGFLQVASHKERVFLHINDCIDLNGRPVNGMRMRFVLQRGDNNQWRASSCQSVETASKRQTRGAASQRQTESRRNASMWEIVVAVVVGLTFLGAVAYMSELLAVWCLAISVVSFSSYATDKRAALKQTWRVPENRLHLQDLLGGWPGGWIARKAWHHKVNKTSFVVTFWLTVVVNIIALVWIKRHVADILPTFIQ